jgi:hypothetical protein
MRFTPAILLFAFALHAFGVQSREQNIPHSLVERGNVTTAEVLETLATARTCDDCQVRCWQLQVIIPAYTYHRTLCSFCKSLPMKEMKLSS